MWVFRRSGPEASARPVRFRERARGARGRGGSLAENSRAVKRALDVFQTGFQFDGSRGTPLLPCMERENFCSFVGFGFGCSVSPKADWCERPTRMRLVFPWERREPVAIFRVWEEWSGFVHSFSVVLFFYRDVEEFVRGNHGDVLEVFIPFHPVEPQDCPHHSAEVAGVCGFCFRREGLDSQLAVADDRDVDLNSVGFNEHVSCSVFFGECFIASPSLFLCTPKPLRSQEKRLKKRKFFSGSVSFAPIDFSFFS